MGVLKCILALFALVFVLTFVECKEFVPVYMWSTQKPNEKVPALHRVGEQSFKDEIVERLRDNHNVVVFAEPTLSPEDFTQRDESGELVFQNLANLKSTTKTSYLPYVQNPVNVFRELEVSVTEVSVEKLHGYSYPETDVLIINLDDAKDEEDRIDMLKRHDEIMKSVFEKLRQRYQNLWGVYTARHTSWVGSDDVPHSRGVRQAFSENATDVTSFQRSSNAFVYFTNASLYQFKQEKVDLQLQLSTNAISNDSVSVLFEDTAAEVKLQLHFVRGKNYELGYYYLNTNSLSVKNQEYNVTVGSELYAPMNFSYHCGDQNFSDAVNVGVFLKNFQIQIFFDDAPTNSSKFSESYDCVGFTSIPIWSGLFVTSILLIIVSLGITMMMEIRTMDRFDDAKGKTITIIASE